MPLVEDLLRSSARMVLESAGFEVAEEGATTPECAEDQLRVDSHEACLSRWRSKLGGEDVVLVDRPGRGYGDDYSPWLLDEAAPVGELVRVQAASVTEEGIVGAR